MLKFNQFAAAFMWLVTCWLKLGFDSRAQTPLNLGANIRHFYI